MRCPRRFATTTRSSSRSTSACSNNWYLRTSYTWSRLYGNYSGLTQSDENGRTSPNVGRLFDYPAMMFQDGGTAVLGPLATDRPNQFKAQFIYQFDFGTSIGVNEYIASGLPISREVGILPTSNYPVNYLGRGSDGRTPMFSQTDMFVQHSFPMGGDKSLQLSLNVLNLFNQDTAVGKYSTYQQDQRRHHRRSASSTRASRPSPARSPRRTS